MDSQGESASIKCPSSYFRFASYTEIGSLQKCSRMNVSPFLEFLDPTKVP